MAVFRRALASPVIRTVVGWHVVWGLVALATSAPFLIEVLNGFVLAIACGVVVAYWPIVRQTLLAGSSSTGELLSVGIWLAWVSVIEQRSWSIGWRLFGKPPGWQDTDFATHFISITLLAGLFHLAGPEAIDGHVPTRQWVRIGAIVACGALVAFALVMFGSSAWGQIAPAFRP